ncbi:MAG TPA: hypothetical protein VMN78_13355 [Longimicrobiales bacterium]|nr:hypothetical protein [Longimicrobiales bacterium]
MTPRSRGASLALTLGLFLLASDASAQEAETGPRRAAPAFAAPESDRAGNEAGRPTGAGPVPEQSGPIGEPAPAAAVTSSEDVRSAAGESPLAGAAAATAGGAADEATGAREETGGPLGSPVSTPTRRSFLPAARASLPGAPVAVLGTAWGATGPVFVEQQLMHSRVVDARLDTKFELKALFAERGLAYPPRDLYFRLFKQEQVLEVWVQDTPGADTYTLLREYPICAIPGRPGPKTRSDDFQAPEGFYYIEGFNPESEFHLSLRLNYPNAADRIIGVSDSWGGDIYIHGGCSTVGCFPMTDETMQELYWLAVEARGAGQSVIPVHVFPARLNSGVMRWLSETFARDRQLVAFWENLREGYAYFEEHRRLPVVSVDGRGRYLFADPWEPADAVEFGTVGEDGPLGAEVGGAARQSLSEDPISPESVVPPSPGLGAAPPFGPLP